MAGTAWDHLYLNRLQSFITLVLLGKVGLDKGSSAAKYKTGIRLSFAGKSLASVDGPGAQKNGVGLPGFACRYGCRLADTVCGAAE